MFILQWFRGWTAAPLPFQNLTSKTDPVFVMCFKKIKRVSKYYENCPCKATACNVQPTGDQNQVCNQLIHYYINISCAYLEKTCELFMDELCSVLVESMLVKL